MVEHYVSNDEKEGTNHRALGTARGAVQEVPLLIVTNCCLLVRWDLSREGRMEWLLAPEAAVRDGGVAEERRRTGTGTLVLW